MREFKKYAQLIAVASFLAIQLPVDTAAGFIEMLRGEKNPEPYQRVAFVGPATVRQVSGEAEKLTGVDRWERVQTGSHLEPGDLLRTREGTVVLRMDRSGSFIKVTSHTILRLAALEKGWDRAALTGKEDKVGFVIRGCRGAADYLDQTGVWQPIAVSEVMPEGTQIRLRAGSVLDLYSTSEMRALRLTGQREATLNAGVLRPKNTGDASLSIVAR